MKKKLTASLLAVCVVCAALVLTACGGGGTTETLTNRITVVSARQNYNQEIILTLNGVTAKYENPLQFRIDDGLWSYGNYDSAKNTLTFLAPLEKPAGTRIEVDLRYAEFEYDKAVNGVKKYSASAGLGEKYAYTLKPYRPTTDKFFHVVQFSVAPTGTGGALPSENSDAINDYRMYDSQENVVWYDYLAYFDANEAMQIRKMTVDETAWKFTLTAAEDEFMYAIATKEKMYFPEASGLELKSYPADGIPKSEFSVWFDQNFHHDVMGIFLVAKGGETYCDTKVELTGFVGRATIFNTPEVN